MHVMVDLETFATTPDAAILQIGAVPFELRWGGAILMADGFDTLVHPCPRRRHDSDTMRWWDDQEVDIRRKVLLQQEGRVLTQVALAHLVDWLDRVATQHGELEGVWAGPAAFDLGVLRHAFAQHGRPLPWSYRIERDDRTVRALAELGLLAPRPVVVGLEPKDADALPPRRKHDALNDAIYQAAALQDMLGVAV